MPNTKADPHADTIRADDQRVSSQPFKPVLSLALVPLSPNRSRLPVPQHLRQRSIPLGLERGRQAINAVADGYATSPHLWTRGLGAGVGGYETVGMDLGEHEPAVIPAAVGVLVRVDEAFAFVYDCGAGG